MAPRTAIDHEVVLIPSRRAVLELAGEFGFHAAVLAHDISDYTAINPAYGTLDDFRDFVEAAHAREIRVIIELVVNHISGHKGGIAGVYNKSELLPERKVALERWAAHVAGLVEGRPAKVVPIRGRGSR